MSEYHVFLSIYYMEGLSVEDYEYRYRQNPLRT